ncbi:MAG: hypothetical protein Kow0062_02700 [Acidobacteriota bacterium]|nr:MAG: biopolymer transporter ExbD [Acidobacteriota bacterium]
MGLRDRIQKVEAEISSASMADIAFLLIIFFMVTAVFSATKGLDFKLPSDDEQQSTEEQEAIFFKVLEDGTFLMDKRPATLDEIRDYVVPKLERWPDKPIIIYARPEAPYEALVGIYDELVKLAKPPENGGYGLLTKPPNISIPTQSEINEYVALFGVNPFEQD